MEENKETKEQVKEVKLVDSKTIVKKPYKPVKRKKEERKVIHIKDKSSYVPANIIPSYMISKTARLDCYVYAVKKVKFDDITKQQEESNEFLLTFRVNQVHETAVWDKTTGEIETNTIYKSLLSQYGLANVKLVNDPYEYK